MNMHSETAGFQENIYYKTAQIIKELEEKAIEREVLARLVVLNIISSSNMFLIGAPGIAKSYMVKKAAHCIEGAKYFEYLMTRTTRPEEILGVPYETEGGVIAYNTKDSIIDSHIPFIDEGFKSPSSVLNSLLGITGNDREFHQRGANRGVVKTEVRAFFTASNEFAENDEASAFVDRLHIVYEPQRIKSPENYKRFLRGDFDKSNYFSIKYTLGEIDAVKAMAEEIIISDFVYDVMVTIKDRMVREKLEASDRKIENAARIMKVSAFCNRRHMLDVSDVILFLHLGWKSFEERDRIKEVVYDTLFRTRNHFDGKLEDIKIKISSQDNVLNNEMEDVFKKRVNLGADLVARSFPIWRKNAETLLNNYDYLEGELREIIEFFEYIESIEEQVRKNIFLVDLLKEKELRVPKPYQRSFDEALISDIEENIVEISRNKRKLSHFLSHCESPTDYKDYESI
jgi:MoxR-like ATPase